MNYLTTLMQARGFGTIAEAYWFVSGNLGQANDGVILDNGEGESVGEGHLRALMEACKGALSRGEETDAAYILEAVLAKYYSDLFARGTDIRAGISVMPFAPRGDAMRMAAAALRGGAAGLEAASSTPAKSKGVRAAASPKGGFVGRVKGLFSRRPKTESGHSKDLRILPTFVGIISSGLRADTSRRHRVGMPNLYESLLAGDGIDRLDAELQAKGVEIKPADLRTDIYQTDDENRSVVELISNAIDAGSKDIKVTVKNGLYEVEDFGRGMDEKVIIERLLIPKLTGKPDPALQIGRFGIGFYTVLRHLKNDGESVVVETSVAGRNAYRLTYLMQNGQIMFHSERIVMPRSGTKISVRAADIKKDAMTAEVSGYMRLANDGLRILVNGGTINSFDYGLADGLDRPGDYARAYYKEGVPRRVTIKIGEVIFESYETDGNTISGELVIELPHGASHSVTRDIVAVDEKLYGYLKGLMLRAEDVATLNTLAALYEKLDGRHVYDESLMNHMGRRAAELIDTVHAGKKVYPDTASLRTNLNASENVVMVHPGFYKPEWLERFSVPDEFESGVITSAGGWRRPIKVALSGDIKTGLYLDQDFGVLYLNRHLYDARPAFVLSALFMVPGLEFDVNWSGGRAVKAGARDLAGGAAAGVLRPVGGRAEESREVKTGTERGVAGADIKGMMGFLEGFGFEISDFAREFNHDYAITGVRDAGSEMFLAVARHGGGWNLINWRTGKRVFREDRRMEERLICIESVERGRTFTVIMTRDSASSVSRVYNGEGNLLTEGRNVEIHTSGDRIFMKRDDGEDEQYILDEEGRTLLEGDHILVDGYDSDWRFYRVRRGGRWYLYDDNIKPISEGRDIRSYEGAGRVWAVVEDDDGNRLYDDSGTAVMQARGGIHVKEVAGRAWVYVEDGGRKRVFDDSMTQVAEGEVVVVSFAGGGIWFTEEEEGRLVVRGGDARGEFDGDRVDVMDVGGRAWFRVWKGETARLYADDMTLVTRGELVDVFDTGEGAGVAVYNEGVLGITSGEKRFELPLGGAVPEDISVTEINSIIWTIVRYDNGAVLYKGGEEIDRGQYVHEREYGGKKYLWLRRHQDAGGDFRFYHGDGDRGSVEYFNEKRVFKVGGHTWFWLDSTLYDEDLNPVFQGYTFYEVIESIDGTVYIFCLYNNNIWKIYTAGGDYVTDSSAFALEKTSLGLVAFYRGHVTPLFELERLAKEPALRQRVFDARVARLHIPDIFYPLLHAEDRVWHGLINDPRKRELLTLIDTSDALHYASLHMDDSYDDLKNALLLIRHIPAPSAIDEDETARRVGYLMRSSLDVARLVSDMENGRANEDEAPVRHYLTSEKVVGFGRSLVPSPASGRKKLADVITHLRLHGRGIGIQGALAAGRYGSEEDMRQLMHAVLHLHPTHPQIFVRELIQNALDVQRVPGRVTTEDGHRIDVDTFMEGSDLVVRIRDYGGMTEEELVRLLLPGEGSKGGGVYRGGFGIGFFTALAGARRVRLMTALHGTNVLAVVEFEVVRDSAGKIADLLVRIDKRPNREGFTGTVVETVRYSRAPLLEAAQVKTRAADIGKYISQTEAKVFVDGEQVNAGRNGALVTFDSEKIGTVSLYDGLENRILLGGLPLADIPDTLWEGIPDGIRDYYRRRGFYLDLDYTRLKAVSTRDRLENQAEVMAELGRILPAILIRGFLKRVATAESPEDMKELPEVYFIEAYGLAGEAKLGRVNIENARRINDGRFADVDIGPYLDGDTGRRNLLSLLTLVKFLHVEGMDEALSLKDVYEFNLKAVSGDEEARGVMAKIKGGYLPEVIRAALSTSAGAKKLADRGQQRVEDEISGGTSDVIDGIEADRVYEPTEIKSEAHRDYLALLQKVAATVWRRFGGDDVKVGINTFRDDAASFAHHFASGGVYHIYPSYGENLDSDAEELAGILSGGDRGIALKRFERFVARMYEIATHELNHVINEHPEDFTHDPKFYRDQMELMLKPEFAANQVEQWFDGLRKY